VQALARTAREHGFDYRLVETTMQVNDRQKTVLGKKVKAYFSDDLRGKTFAIWGLAFKPETDDIREAPALELIKELKEAGANVRAFDPEAMNNVKAIFGDAVYFAEDQYDAIAGTDALVIVTEWSEFRNPDFKRIEAALKSKAIFDGRNVYSLDKMKTLPFYYESIGRDVVK
jgi:UDPglucose 6-dehydrogenase